MVVGIPCPVDAPTNNPSTDTDADLDYFWNNIWP